MWEIVVNLQFQILVPVTFKHTYVHWTNKSISLSQVLPMSRHIDTNIDTVPESRPTTRTLRSDKDVTSNLDTNQKTKTKQNYINNPKTYIHKTCLGLGSLERQVR